MYNTGVTLRECRGVWGKEGQHREEQEEEPDTGERDRLPVLLIVRVKRAEIGSMTASEDDLIGQQGMHVTLT